jgi:hypothetical protein
MIVRFLLNTLLALLLAAVMVFPFAHEALADGGHGRGAGKGHGQGHGQGPGKGSSRGLGAHCPASAASR